MAVVGMVCGVRCMMLVAEGGGNAGHTLGVARHGTQEGRSSGGGAQCCVLEMQQRRTAAVADSPRRGLVKALRHARQVAGERGANRRE